MIILKQKSIFNSSEFEIENNGINIGYLNFPLFFNATNARIKFKNHKNINFLINNIHFDITFTYTSRSFNNEVEHNLINDKNESIAKIFIKNKEFIFQSENKEFILRKKLGFLKSKIEIYNNNMEVAKIEDFKNFSIKREISFSKNRELKIEEKIFLIYFFIVLHLN